MEKRHMDAATVSVRFLFVDAGEYREETMELPTGDLETYDRLIDWLREDSAVLAVAHFDLTRLCSASLA